MLDVQEFPFEGLELHLVVFVAGSLSFRFVNGTPPSFWYQQCDSFYVKLL